MGGKLNTARKGAQQGLLGAGAESGFVDKSEMFVFPAAVFIMKTPWRGITSSRTLYSNTEIKKKKTKRPLC